jgi:hypothetical protein
MLFKFAEMPPKCEGTYFLPFFLLLFLLKASKGLPPPKYEEHSVMMLERTDTATSCFYFFIFLPYIAS